MRFSRTFFKVYFEDFNYIIVGSQLIKTFPKPVAPAKYKDLGRKECCRLLCEDCHAQMVKMAGIEQNMWQPVSDL